jgi:hypothetical protein
MERGGCSCREERGPSSKRAPEASEKSNGNDDHLVRLAKPVCHVSTGLQRHAGVDRLSFPRVNRPSVSQCGATVRFIPVHDEARCQPALGDPHRMTSGDRLARFARDTPSPASQQVAGTLSRFWRSFTIWEHAEETRKKKPLACRREDVFTDSALGHVNNESVRGAAPHAALARQRACANPFARSLRGSQILLLSRSCARVLMFVLFRALSSLPHWHATPSTRSRTWDGRLGLQDSMRAVVRSNSGYGTNSSARKSAVSFSNRQKSESSRSAGLR